MESKIIFITSERLKPKIKWDEKDGFNYGWIYCGEGSEFNLNLVEDYLTAYFTASKFYVVTIKRESFEMERAGILDTVKVLIGKHFIVWDSSFLRAIEFNAIGVFRKGKIESAEAIGVICPELIVPSSLSNLYLHITTGFIVDGK